MTQAPPVALIGFGEAAMAFADKISAPGPATTLERIAAARERPAEQAA